MRGKMFRTPLLLTAAIGLCCAETLLAARESTSTPIYQFSNGTSVENLAVRTNGNILITLLYEAEIHEINPTQSGSGNATKLVHSFDDSTRVNGISELSPDVFAISANHDTVWIMDLNGGGDAQVSKVVTIPDASFLNGVATLDSAAGTILVADSTAGVIWLVNTSTGEFSDGLQDVTMAPPANSSSGGLSLGANGVKYRDGYVYYTNTGRKLFCRVKIDPTTGNATGPYETIVEGFAGDDFALIDDAAFVASGSSNAIEKIFFNGTQELVAGGSGSTDVAGATSAMFGVTENDADVLYVTTSGGGVGGGKVVAIRIS